MVRCHVPLQLRRHLSGSLTRMPLAQNIVGFLSMQNHAIDASVAALTDTTTMLSGARVRNYDLSSALAVLSTGTYPALPSSLREPFESGSAPLDDAQVLDTLTEVDDVLCWRLVMGREIVPPPMTRVPWRIHDGRVTFVVPGLWEASFTYGGGAKDEDEGQEGAEWFLLGVRFLFRVRDARGCEFPLLPLASMRERRLPPFPLLLARSSRPALQLGRRLRSGRSRSTSSTCATANCCDGLTSHRQNRPSAPRLRRPLPHPQTQRHQRLRQTGRAKLRQAQERTRSSRTRSRRRGGRTSAKRLCASAGGTGRWIGRTPSCVRRTLPCPSRASF